MNKTTIHAVLYASEEMYNADQYHMTLFRVNIELNVCVNIFRRDYGVRSLESILDIVKVMDFALQDGKVNLQSCLFHNQCTR